MMDTVYAILKPIAIVWLAIGLVESIAIFFQVMQVWVDIVWYKRLALAIVFFLILTILWPIKFWFEIRITNESLDKDNS